MDHRILEPCNITMGIRAIVAYAPVKGLGYIPFIFKAIMSLFSPKYAKLLSKQFAFKHVEDLKLREINPSELVVDIVASGVCHTDLFISSLPLGQYPRVAGHEGSGIVRQVGSKVTVAKPGDFVLLSYNFCNACANCKHGHPSHCKKFQDLNGVSVETVFSQGKTEIGGKFFGQSSFASATIVAEESVVNVTNLVSDKSDLIYMAPLGCGLQTGAGAVLHNGRAAKNEAVVIYGIGGVGLGAIAAAKQAGCYPIIAVDIQVGRFETAKQLGASHTIKSDKELKSQLDQLTDGVGPALSIECTGNINVIKGAIDNAASRGRIVLVGLGGLTDKLTIKPIEFLSTGKEIIGCIEGDVIAREFVPKMIQWYYDGHLPLKKFCQVFEAKDFKEALHDMESGKVIKPILKW